MSMFVFLGLFVGLGLSFSWEDGGRCLKLGEICNRENQCDAGLVCEEVVPGEMHVCRPSSAGRKQYYEDCNSSSECDVTRGLCCIMQRRHRQKPRKICGYYNEPLVCIGPVVTDQIQDGGRCLPAFTGRKLDEICNRENQCVAGLVCEEVVPGEMHVCRPPNIAQKQYYEECNSSSECDVTRGLCCIMQRRHRQKPRKSCGYFKEPLVCIGPVATDQIREFVQHTAGEKRIGVYGLH